MTFFPLKSDVFKGALEQLFRDWWCYVVHELSYLKHCIKLAIDIEAETFILHHDQIFALVSLLEVLREGSAMLANVGIPLD